VTRQNAGQVTGRRIGKAGAREFTLVTAGAGIATLGLALMFGAAVQASPGADPVPPTPVAVATARSTTTTSAPSSSTTTTSTPTPTATTEAEVATTVTEVVAIPFTKQTVEDGAVAKGKTVVRTAGRDGSQTVTWLVRTKGGIEVGRTVSGEEITRQPVTEVTAVGTKAPAPTSTPKPAPTTTAASGGKCDPNYSGACVPIATDVDCSSGSGNGPAYVRGPVTVVGTDIYDLDSDGDGIGCEKG
jgi:hypothetical protein